MKIREFFGLLYDLFMEYQPEPETRRKAQITSLEERVKSLERQVNHPRQQLDETPEEGA